MRRALAALKLLVRLLVPLLVSVAGTGGVSAASVVHDFCGRSTPLTAGQQDRLLRFAALVRAELDQQGPAAVLIARSGLDLSRFGLRYSHAGLALADGAGSAWAVRQLYYACDEGRPRLFDQGLAGFVAGTSDPERGFVSLLLLPPAAAAMLAHTALDRPRALRLLADRYSANAHAWSLRYQNCNQWLIELLAASEGTLADGPDLRARAQDWLRDAGYQPAAVDAGSHLLMFAAGFVPWLRLDDRPEDQRYSLTFQLTLPRSLEVFVRQRWPEARRIALCHAGDQVLVRRGWAPLPEDCRASPGDEVRTL
jgi:hypothetical protein